VGEDDLLEFRSEIRVVASGDFVAQFLDEVLRQIADSLGLHRVGFLVKADGDRRVVSPCKRRVEVSGFVSRAAKAFVVQKLHFRAMRIRGECQDVGERALAAAPVSDDGDEARIQVDNFSVEPMLVERRTSHLLHAQGLHVFGGVARNVVELRRTDADIAAERWLAAHLLQPLKRRLSLQPGDAVVRVTAIVSHAMGIAAAEDRLGHAAKIVDELWADERLGRMAVAEKQIDVNLLAGLEAVGPLHQVRIGVGMAAPIKFF
jgi:hypothetical protein